jgi:predicted GIY-YIG superfamily endonuclease
MEEMKMNRKKYVYQLVNENNVVEYIGESFNPIARYKEHVHHKFRPKKGMGKFYGRTNLSLEVLAEFDNPKEAFDYQCELQKKYFGIDDRDKAIQNGMKGKEFGYLGAQGSRDYWNNKKRAGIINS